MRESTPKAVSAIASQGAIRFLGPVFVSLGLFVALLVAFADKTSTVTMGAMIAVKAYVADMNPWAVLGGKLGEDVSRIPPVSSKESPSEGSKLENPNR